MNPLTRLYLTEKCSEEIQKINHAIDRNRSGLLDAESRCSGAVFDAGENFSGAEICGGGDGEKPGVNVDERTRENGGNTLKQRGRRS